MSAIRLPSALRAERMVGMGIGSMMMVMVMVPGMMVFVVVNMICFEPAFTGAEGRAERAVGDV